jgi:NADH-quinone oxidoreductase subunit J
MLLTAIAFYVFSAILIACAAMVVLSRNPVHSVFFLILAFFNAAALFVLLGAEFLAMILVIVYVGAVALLFIFVVMMLDVDFAELKRGLMKYLPLGAAVGIALLAELIIVSRVWTIPTAAGSALASATPAHVTNTAALGLIIYTKYIYYFQIAGLVLLVAMIGAIVLTLRHRPGVRRQSISKQNARTAAMSVEIVDVQPGQGG